MRNLVAIWIALFVCVAVSTKAAPIEPDAATFLRKYDASDGTGKGFWALIAAATQSGIQWANLEGNSHPIYCQPPNVALMPGEIVEMVRRETIDVPAYASYPLGMVILRALEATFPCSPKQ